MSIRPLGAMLSLIANFLAGLALVFSWWYRCHPPSVPPDDAMIKEILRCELGCLILVIAAAVCLFNAILEGEMDRGARRGSSSDQHTE